MSRDPRVTERDPFRRATAADRFAAELNRAAFVTRAHLRPLWRWRIPIRRVQPAGPIGLNLVVVGTKVPIRYFLKRLVGRDWREEPLATMPLLALPWALDRLSAGSDLVMARVPRPASRWFFGDAYIHVPGGVDAWVEVPEDTEALAQRSTRARRNTNLVLRSGLNWTTSVTESDFDLFYDRFYVPFVRQRYPDSGASGGERKLRELFHLGFLLWIRQGEEKLAGAILKPDGEVMRWFVVGARTDGVDPVKSGALSAIYVFGLECSRRHGFRWFDVGWSPPSLRDGVLSHKRSWGAILKDSPRADHDTLFRWETLDNRLMSFLSENPLIFRDDGGLSAIAALPLDARADLATAWAAYRKVAMAGLRRVYLVSASGWSAVPVMAAAADGTGLWLADRVSSREFRRTARPAPVL